MYHPTLSSSPQLDELLNRTGYHIKQDNGQRIYFNPTTIDNPPPRGCELFVGRLPRDILEDTLIPIFESAGTIFKCRLMMDFNGRNRGFCFVTYFSTDAVRTAIKLFDGYELRPGCKIGVFKSIDNTRLFVGGIPIDKTREQVLNAFKDFVEGIKEVIMYPSNTDQSVNRGYVFIEFETHRYAAIARRRLQPGSLILWESNILVDWAEPLPEPDPNIMAKVTKLYCRNINVHMTQDVFAVEISKIIPAHTMLKLYKKNDYAFLHFVNRASSEDAYKLLQGVEIGGRKLEVMWARPEFYSNINSRNIEPDHFCLSIPAKVRRIIRLRQAAMQKKHTVTSVIPRNFIYPTSHPIAPFHPPPPAIQHPIAFHPNFFLQHMNFPENAFAY